jgi:hypothetical protein
VSTIPVGFLVLAVISCGGVPLAFAPRPRAQRRAGAGERVSWAETLRSFFVNPRQHPDFFWAFTRLTLIVGYWSIVSFQLYILDDYIGLGLDKANELVPADHSSPDGHHRGARAVGVAVRPDRTPQALRDRRVLRRRCECRRADPLADGSGAITSVGPADSASGSTSRSTRR